LQPLRWNERVRHGSSQTVIGGSAYLMSGGSSSADSIVPAPSYRDVVLNIFISIVYRHISARCRSPKSPVLHRVADGERGVEKKKKKKKKDERQRPRQRRLLVNACLGNMRRTLNGV